MSVRAQCCQSHYFSTTPRRLHWNTQSHFCHSDFINGRSETMSTGDFRSLLHRVPTYDEKHSIYPHAIFCTTVSFTTKDIMTINILPLSTKRINLIIITIKKLGFSFKINSVLLQDNAGLLGSVPLQAQKPLINTIFIGENRYQ